MILDVVLTKKSKKGLSKSAYNPGKKEKERLSEIMSAFNHSREIMTRPYEEFNNLSIIDRLNTDQRSFNAYIEPKSDDPTEEWKSNAYRPIVRNKIISIAAHITGALMYPQIFAQNENDEEDKAAAAVMRDLMEWRAGQADYDRTFLYSVIGALVNPATIIHTEYAEVNRTIKEITGKDKWEEKVVPDELFSGPQDTIVPVDELYIENIYEHDEQKQGWLIWRRVISYTTAQSKYSTKDNWKYVKPSLQTVFDATEDTFYDAYDDELSDSLVEEVIYYNRTNDLQIAVVGGIMMDDPDQPNPRKDKKYPFAKTGYELFDEGKFFYYRSLAAKLKVDEDVVNVLYRMIIDGTFLQLMPPLAVYGNEDVGSDILLPGMVTSLNETTKVQAITAGGNLNAGMSVLEKVEGSINESSSDVLQSGAASSGNQTAFEISRLEQNARVMLGLFGKMIGFLVKDIGELFISDILQFMTIGEVEKLSNVMQFRTFMMPDKNVDGKKVTRKIDFDGEMPDEMTDMDEEEMSFGLLKEEGDLSSDKEIWKVNPKAFREMKYTANVTPDIVNQPSDNVKKALAMEEYDRAVNSPHANQKALYQDLLLGAYEMTKNDVEKYTKEEEPAPEEPAPGGPQGGAVASVAAAEKLAV